ncbi:MAG: tol-pal system protein YbgF [Candidatus Rokubacteria bacterium]|nr:tol-pal system protein YbgF [Candidatus Rokubacteria bacterium]
MNRALGVVAVMAVIATGCASRGTVKRLASEVSQLRSDLTDTRAAQEAAGREIGRTQSELEALDARTRELGPRVRATAEEVARLAEQVRAAGEAIRRTRAALDALPAPAAPAAEPARAPRVGGPAQAYAAALATFRAREHGQAVIDFLDFIAKYPKHALAGNAQYWIGEAYYVQRDYRQALLEFQKVFELGAGKIPDALVKIGLCYWSLRDPKRARQTWQKVVREYPGTEAARIARVQLRTRAARTR